MYLTRQISVSVLYLPVVARYLRVFLLKCVTVTFSCNLVADSLMSADRVTVVAVITAVGGEYCNGTNIVIITVNCVNSNYAAM